MGSWGLVAGVVGTTSRGQIRLSGPNPDDPVLIDANNLSHPDDLKAAIACVELCREIGNSASLSPLIKREVMPGNLKGAAIEDFIREGALSYWASDVFCQNGPRCNVGCGRKPQSLWN
jgi:choline dehydrogenase